MTTPRPGETRRAFLKQGAAATVVLASVDFAALAAGAAEVGSVSTKANSAGKLPWYRRTLRWGQTNITEIDISSTARRAQQAGRIASGWA